MKTVTPKPKTALGRFVRRHSWLIDKVLESLILACLAGILALTLALAHTLFTGL